MPSSCASTGDNVNFPPHSQDSYSELEQYVANLLSAQLRLARSSRAKTTYSIVLKQRLTILQRILHAFQAKYHVKDKVNLG